MLIFFKINYYIFYIYIKNLLTLMSGCSPCVPQGLVHSYREAFEDVEADGFTHSAPYGSGGGGENSPQTPRFPVSPQTPYFNMCRFTLSK